MFFAPSYFGSSRQFERRAAQQERNYENRWTEAPWRRYRKRLYRASFGGMEPCRYTITCRWDPEASVWYVAESDVPGLVTEAATIEEMERKLRAMVPELLALNESEHIPGPVPFELIARKEELSA